MFVCLFFFFFFFQAEDGIRDLTVTGVQTCALPILGVVDYEVVGQEVVVLLNPEIVCLPDSDLLDASHPVAVDAGPSSTSQCRQRPRRCDVVPLLERSKTAPAVDGEKGMFSGRSYFATEHSAEAVDHPLSARARLEHAPRT